MKNPKILVILGPTASGKSDLAIKLAKFFNGEVVSADSRQVYRGMDIGSGKIKIQNSKVKSNGLYAEGIRHHLLDVVQPNEYFSVARYQKLALKTIKDIQRRGKLPIICGGTGLYISALIEGWQLINVPPSDSFRQELEKLNKEELFSKLEQLDSQRAKTIDKNNKRRLIRALEIAALKGSVPPLIKKPPQWDVFVLGIRKDKEELKKLILKRLKKRLSEGMIKEVKKLKEEGVSSKRLEEFGLEYRWLNRYLENKCNLEEMKKNLFKDSCHYAKRQMTWFKKMKNIWWVENEKEALAATYAWLKN